MKAEKKELQALLVANEKSKKEPLLSGLCVDVVVQCCGLVLICFCFCLMNHSISDADGR